MGGLRVNFKNLIIFSLFICLGASLFINVFFCMQTLDLRNEIEKQKDQINNLTSQIDSLNDQIDDLMHTRNFTFELPHHFGFLRMELTFRISEGNLSITAKLNQTQCGFVLVFDRNGDGAITIHDEGWLLYGSSKYLPAYVTNITSGEYGFPMCLPFSSSFHYSTEDENEITFHISFPLDTLGLQNDLAYVSAEGVLGRGVLFHFNLEV